jgi:hypothetical protein
VGNNVQAFFDHPRQNANNVQRPTGNVGLRSASMGPPTDNMGPSTSNMGPRPSSMGPRPGSMNPRPGNMGPPTGNMGPPMNSRPGNVPSQNYGRVNPSTGQPMLPARPPGQNMPPRTASGDYYASHPNAIPPAQGPPNHQRIRNLTTHMLTHSNMSERSIIDHYQQEIEWVRQFQYTRDMVTFTDQIFGSVMQQVRQQFVDQPPDFVLQIIDTLLMRYGLIRPIQQGQRYQMGQMSGGSQSAQQQGSQVHGSRPVQQNVQQPGSQRPVQAQQMGGQLGGQQSQQNGQRVFPGGQQPAPQQHGMQQSNSHPIGPLQHGLVDFGPQQPAVQRSGSQQPSALQGPSGQAGLQQSGQRVLSGSQQYDVQHVAAQQPDLQHVAVQQSTSQQSGQRVISSGQPPTIEQLTAQQSAIEQPTNHQPAPEHLVPEDLVPEDLTAVDPFPVLNSAHPSQQTSSQEKPKSISKLASGVGLLPSPMER